jgi:TPR repeat protein
MRTTEKAKEAERLAIKGYYLAEKGQIALAIRTYKKAAEMGDEIAMSNLGNLLDDKIRPSKPKEAVYWYKRAVRRGHWVAAWNLAVHYKNLGKRRWQVHWLRVAQRLGDPEARVELRRLT